ncbi:MAG: HNH endonuclease [Rhizobiaceae bacterium]
MREFVFLGIGWMREYRGHDNDDLEGGGSYPEEHGDGGEVFNFQPMPDGNVYGHVETSRKGSPDRQIRIERFGAQPGAPYVDGRNIAWVATHPEEGGRRIVGFYRNARLYRRRQNVPAFSLDRGEATTFMTTCAQEDAALLPEDGRTLRLGRPPGWMGQTQWWRPDPAKRLDFLRDVDRLFSELFDVADAANQLDEPDIPGGLEGRKRQVTHFRRERDAAIIQEKKRRTPKPWLCEICHFDFNATYGDRSGDYIEIHHDIPLATYPIEGAVTDYDQLRLVCSNCHRMIHRRSTWLKVAELRSAFEAAAVARSKR